MWKAEGSPKRWQLTARKERGGLHKAFVRFKHHGRQEQGSPVTEASFGRGKGGKRFPKEEGPGVTSLLPSLLSFLSSEVQMGLGSPKGRSTWEPEATF